MYFCLIRWHQAVGEIVPLCFLRLKLHKSRFINKFENNDKTYNGQHFKYFFENISMQLHVTLMSDVSITTHEWYDNMHFSFIATQCLL